MLETAAAFLEGDASILLRAVSTQMRTMTPQSEACIATVDAMRVSLVWMLRTLDPLLAHLNIVAAQGVGIGGGAWAYTL